MVSLIKSIKAHSDKAWSVSAHKTVPLLATASTDKTSKIYKLSVKQNFPQVAQLEDTHKRSVRAVSFKPPLPGVESNFLDLPALALGSFDSTISIWGIDEPETEVDDEEILENAAEILLSPRNEWNLMAIIEGHENEIKAVGWNHNGSLLASCSRDKTVWIWETDPETLEEFECISVLNDHQHDIKHVVWHPHQNLLALSSYDDTIRLYKQDLDDDDWSCVGVLNGHEGTVWCSQFEDNHRHQESNESSNRSKIRLVSVSDDMTARIWSSGDVDEPERNEEYIPSSIKHKSEMVWEQESILPPVHQYPIYSVAWSAQSGKIATVGSDGKIVIYIEGDDNSWSIDSVKESAHGVHEINSIIWALLDDQLEVLVTAGDDGCVNIWKP